LTTSGDLFAGYWQSNMWHELPLATGAASSFLVSADANTSNVFAVGFCMNSNGDYLGGAWEDGVWTSMAHLASETIAMIMALAVVQE
jgi:hypothetical protein